MYLPLISLLLSYTKKTSYHEIITADNKFIFLHLAYSAQDCLIDGASYKSKVQTTHAEEKRLELTNGLLVAQFLPFAPNAHSLGFE